MITDNGESVNRLIVEKVRRKVAATDKLMVSDGSFAKKRSAPERVVSFNETLPRVEGYQVPASQGPRRGGASVNDLPNAPKHSLETTKHFQFNPFASGYNKGAQTTSPAPDRIGEYHLREARSNGVRMPQVRRPGTAAPSSVPSPGAVHHYQRREQVKSEPLSPSGSTAPSVASFDSFDSMGGGRSGGGGERRRRRTKSARQGHLERMAETLADFGDELIEAQQEPDEDEEFENQIDSMRRLYDRMVQKMDSLKLLPPPEE
ncbi:hypothetical protein PG994_001257 [Apiospora phragmitis]|uniref:Uncharacterized protein n=1 Tax=Apiospora phragmitis TaxID=2905665 RepID=A0ABR1WT06_9PEZI